MLAASRKAIISKAGYATAAAANGFKISTASNGVKVASSQESGETASLAVVINGGARAESAQNAGVAHFLKNYGFKNNTSRTGFRIARETELAGAVLSSQLSHESLVFAAEILKDDIELFAEILSDVVSKQKYQEHEFVDVVHQTAAEAINAYNCAETRAIETAHQVAFRNGLGNSIFAKPTAHVNNATVKAFAQHIFTQSNVALVGTGIDHEILSNLADTYLNLPQGQVDLAATKYYGGESRIDDEKAGEYVIAFEGAAAGSVDYNALQVLRYALGGESVVQNASPVGVLAQTAAKFSEGTAIKAFNLGYSDAGLFGVQVSAASAETGAAAAAAAEQLKAVASGLDSAVFEQALAQAKYAAATSAFDTRLDRVQTLGAQAFGAVAASTAQVTSADVANVAAKLLKGKPTTVALGDLTVLPYADTLSL